MAGDTEVDQEILNAAGKVIPNIVNVSDLTDSDSEDEDE